MLPGNSGGAPLSSATARNEFLGSVTFGPRGGGNAWIIVAIVAAAFVFAIWIGRKS